MERYIEKQSSPSYLLNKFYKLSGVNLSVVNARSDNDVEPKAATKKQ